MESVGKGASYGHSLPPFRHLSSPMSEGTPCTLGVSQAFVVIGDRSLETSPVLES